METKKPYSFRDLPLDVRLSAYLDGQMDADESHEIEELIAADDEARSIVDKLALGSEFGTKAFDDMLKEPVPLHLVRAIKDAAAKAETGKPSLRPANNNFFSFLPRAIAASAILLLAGGYSGYYFGMQNAAKTPSVLTETSGFEIAGDDEATATKTRSFNMPAPAAKDESSGLTLDDVMAGYLRVYRSETAHLVEVSADQPDAIKTWLKEVTAVDFAIPDLSADGYEFKGARLLAASGQPMGTLFYRNDKGQTIMVGFWDLRMKEKAEVDAMTDPVLTNDASVTFWNKGETGVYFVAPDDLAGLATIRDKVRAAL